MHVLINVLLASLVIRDCGFEKGPNATVCAAT